MEVSCCSAAAPSLPLPLPLPPRPAPRSPAPPCAWELPSLVRPVDPDADGKAAGTDATGETDPRTVRDVRSGDARHRGQLHRGRRRRGGRVGGLQCEAVAPVASEPSASARLICGWPGWPGPALEALGSVHAVGNCSCSFGDESFANAALPPPPAVRVAAPETAPGAALEAPAVAAVPVELDPKDPADDADAGALLVAAALPAITALPAASVVVPALCPAPPTVPAGGETLAAAAADFATASERLPGAEPAVPGVAPPAGAASPMAPAAAAGRSPAAEPSGLED